MNVGAVGGPELKREIIVGLAMLSVELEEKQQKRTVDVPQIAYQTDSKTCAKRVK